MSADRQREQQYGNKHGMPIGRAGNCLGNVSAFINDIDSGFQWVASRPNSHGEIGPAAPLDAFAEEDSTDDVGLPEIMLAMLTVLTERQRFVIECRYGLRPGMDGERLSQREIAALMNVRYQAIQSLEERGLAALRRGLSKPVEHEGS
jgi:DNA-directed RNA polymerase specialized sigma24 family protein